MKLNNEKIRSLTYPEFFVYISVRSRFYLKQKSGHTESKIDVLFQKWPTDDPSYYNATKMFSIKNVCYQRVNCYSHCFLLII